MEDDFLPPPPKAKSESQPLSNADFRKLFETPRRGDGGDGGENRHGGGKGRGDGFKKKKSRPKPEEPKKEEEASGYRDRAEERRKGFNPDYEHVAASLPGQGEAALAELSVKDSKFLGGDVEHTHLVKGLDYALLRKVKGELTKDEEVQPDGKKGTAVRKAEEVKFVTPTGRAIYNALFNPVKLDVSEMFLPRRTAFVYDLDEEFSPSDIPTMLRRSKADCPQVVEMAMGMVDSALLERMAKIMSYVRLSAGGKPVKRLKRKDKLSILGIEPDGKANGKKLPPPPPPLFAPAPNKEEEEEEDIFGDSTPAAPREANGAQTGTAPSGLPAKPGGSYFGEFRDDMKDLPPLPAPSAAGKDEDVDMEIEEGEALPPPPPPPREGGDMVGPARPPAGMDPAQAYGYPSADAYPSEEEYVQANVAYQASLDPEYQALVARQQGFREDGQNGASTQPSGGLTKEENDEGKASVFKREEGGRRRELDNREKDPAYVSDAYAECYPGYHEYAGTVVDSDEEDFTHMDGKEKGRSRVDFDTEEQWQAYKSSKEMMPKAAFQFGVKVTDGRKTAKGLGAGGGKRDQKMENQLHKIKDVLDKQGKDYGPAFEASAMDDVGTGGGVSKKRRI